MVKIKLPKQVLFFLFPIVCVLTGQNSKQQFVCTPCNLDCDELVFNEPGKCPKCGMDLINSSALEEGPQLNDMTIKTGSGSFLMEGGKGSTDKHIKVFYHKPKNFTIDSRVLLVIPGAGRNGDGYRDAWIEESEKFGVVILSPQYPEKEYPFEAYHLGGIVNASNLLENIEFIKNTNIAQLNEDGLDFTVNQNPEEWIFNDFDRIFELVKKELQLSRATYDIFGHSAGGHILHRFVLFYDGTSANSIYASNASFYTLPDFEKDYPFGLHGTPMNEEKLKASFQKNLVVFLGELDNESETGGTFLRSETADDQGLHRLARGKYFFERAKEMAEQLNCDFNWKMVIVPSVGHSHELMGAAAGNYLYGL